MCTVDTCVIGRVNPLTELPKTGTRAVSPLPSSAVSQSTGCYCMIKLKLIQKHQNRHGVDPVVAVAILKRHSSEENCMLQLQLCKH